MAVSPFLRYVEARASRIEDPVERLRYLRRMTTLPAFHWTISFRGMLRWSIPAIAILILVTAPWRELKSTSRAGQAIAHPGAAAPPATAAAAAMETQPAPVEHVWQVDRQSQFEVYSNGLRVERVFETANTPRTYLMFQRDGTGDPKKGHEPVGIVFHTTESLLIPFDSMHNESLRRFGKNLLQFARQNQLYHFVVDRFGRVYRIVRELDAANHAGHSVWADSKSIYIRLNQSFLGIAFEGKSAGFGEDAIINDAQIHAARLLTDMLRDKYRIQPENCVTHAQVSVAPVARKIGYHTDWAANFPFAAFGLPNNYHLPVPGLDIFGFEYDPEYMALAGPDLAMVLKLSDGRLAAKAKARGTTVGVYRASLHKEFQRLADAMRLVAAVKESD